MPVPVPQEVRIYKGADAERCRGALVALLEEEARGPGKVSITGPKVRAKARCSADLAARLVRLWKAGEVTITAETWDWERGEAPAAPARSVRSEDDEEEAVAELADRIRSATKDGEREAVAQEAAALVALGALSKDRGSAIAALLLRAHMSAAAERAAPKSDPDAKVPLTADELELVRHFGAICSDARRQAVVDLTAQLLEEDLRELPAIDPNGAL